MKINLNNEKKINETLEMVAGDARRYTFTDRDELTDYIEEAEELAKTWKLNKAELKGLRVEIKSKASTYSNSRESACSSITLERGASGWFLVGCSKIYRFRKAPEHFEVVTTPNQQKLAVNRCFPAYRI